MGLALKVKEVAVACLNVLTQHWLGKPRETSVSSSCCDRNSK